MPRDLGHTRQGEARRGTGPYPGLRGRGEPLRRQPRSLPVRAQGSDADDAGVTHLARLGGSRLDDSHPRRTLPGAPGRAGFDASALRAVVASFSLMPPTLQFLGATGTVTGSMHLVTIGERRVLLDCGLFQGLKALRLRNWGVRLTDAAHLDAVVLSHAHIDHSGYLPLLARQGFRGPIYCTAGTADLLGVVLPDAARLQQEDADRANRRGYSKHAPALPLYTPADAQAALGLVWPCDYDTAFPVTDGVTALLRQAGHILGSATVELDLEGTRLVFSGDLGRYDRPILPDPAPVPAADVLLLESTYGNRSHPPGAEDDLARVVRAASQRGGVILVPAFAVDRTQELLWILHRLEQAGQVPALPVYIDSPMAIEVTEIYRRHPEDCDAEMAQALASGDRPLAA